MLDFVRTKQKSILIKIAFGLIILSFIIGYTMLTAPSEKGGGANKNVAARVNGDEISYSAFQNAYSSLFNLYQSIYKGSLNKELEKQFKLPEQALRQLVSESLLVQEASRLGIEVSKQELIDAISQNSAFQENGQFSRSRYLELLNYQRLSPEQYEASQRRQLLTKKVREQIQQGVQVSEEELQQAFHEENDKVSLDFVSLSPELVETKVQIEEKGLADFFSANKESFRLPEKISLRYLQFEPARYEKEIANFTDDDLDRYYRRNLDLFEIKEQVKASHILLKVPEGADADTVQKRQDLAADLLNQLKNGADFAQLATLHSDDKGTASKGGELGFFQRGTMVSEFENAAFSLRPGQLSDLVRTKFGFHIIKVEEYVEPGVKPLVDVIAEVKTGLKIEKSRQLAFEKAMDAYNINRKTGDLEAAAKTNDLGIKETGFFGTEDPIDGIGTVPEVTAAAFNLKDSELARPIQTTQGIFLIKIKDRQPSRIPELAEVRPAVERGFRAEKAQTLAKDLAEKLLRLSEEKQSLQKAADELKLKIEKTGDFNRRKNGLVRRIGKSQDLMQAAFKLTEKAPILPQVYPVDNKFIVASLRAVKIDDFATLTADKRKALEDQLLSKKKSKVVDDKIQQLVKQSQVEIMIPELSNVLLSEKEPS